MSRTTDYGLDESEERLRDRGSSFIEMLVSIVVLGIAGIAVLAGMAASLRGTSAHDRLATVQANLADAGDHLTDVTYEDASNSDANYISCATPGDYVSEVATFDVDVTAVQYWTGAGWNPDVSTCSGAQAVAMQQITLESTIDGMTRELVVVKRRATVANTPGGEWDDGMVTPAPHTELTP